MIDQLPGRIDQVLEKGIFHSPNDKALSGRVDVFAGNLEQIVFFAQFAQTGELFHSVSGRHIGNGTDSVFL